MTLYIEGIKIYESILAGGKEGLSTINTFSTILEYDHTSDSYTEAGTMTQARDAHAVTVVQYEDFSNWCS